MVDISNKPTCEVICPFDHCRDVLKLASIKQIDLSAPPKFNSFNFQRHVTTKHFNKKRKSSDENKTPMKRFVLNETVTESTDCEISQGRASSDEFQFRAATCSTPLESVLTPKSSIILKLRKDLSNANEMIKAFKIDPSTSENSNAMTPKSIRIDKLSTNLSVAEKKNSELQEENIILRHKYMDASGTIRTICRIKPHFSGEAVKWERSKDGTNLQLCMYKMLHCFI